MTFQLLSLDTEPSAKFLELVAKQTIQAQENDSMLANKPEVDLMLRVALTTQIATAMEKVGYRRNGIRVLIAIGSQEALRRVWRHLTGQGASQRLGGSGITEEERKRVELAALLNVERG